jgi:hypothetical protein
VQDQHSNILHNYVYESSNRLLDTLRPRDGIATSMDPITRPKALRNERPLYESGVVEFLVDECNPGMDRAARL